MIGDLALNDGRSISELDQLNLRPFPYDPGPGQVAVGDMISPAILLSRTYAFLRTVPFLTVWRFLPRVVLLTVLVSDRRSFPDSLGFLPIGTVATIVLVHGDPDKPKACEIKAYVPEQDCYVLATV